METLTYSSGRASGCDSPGLLNCTAEKRSYCRSGVRRAGTGGKSPEAPLPDSYFSPAGLS